MKLMGPKRITHVKMKIIAMLRYGYHILCLSLSDVEGMSFRHCLRFKDCEVTELTLSAWNQFIHW